MTSGPWYNTYICKELHGNIFEGFIRNARTNRYNIMRPIVAHKKRHPSCCDDGNSGKDGPLPSNSTTEARCNHRFYRFFDKSLRTNFHGTLSYISFKYEQIVS